MGNLTAAQLAGEVLLGLGNRTDVTNVMLSNALNLAQSRLARLYDFIELSHVYNFTIPNTGNPSTDKFLQLNNISQSSNTIKDIHSFVIEDGAESRKLIEKPWRWFDSEFPLPEYDAPSWPVLYIRWGGVLTIWPTPLKDFTAFIRATIWPLLLDVDARPGQFSDFDQKDDILIYLAIAYHFRLRGRKDLAKDWWDEANVLIGESIGRDDTRPDLDTTSTFPTPIALSTYWANPFIQGISSLGNV